MGTKQKKTNKKQYEFVSYCFFFLNIDTLEIFLLHSMKFIFVCILITVRLAWTSWEDLVQTPCTSKVSYSKLLRVGSSPMDSELHHFMITESLNVMWFWRDLWRPSSNPTAVKPAFTSMTSSLFLSVRTFNCSSVICVRKLLLKHSRNPACLIWIMMFFQQTSRSLKTTTACEQGFFQSFSSSMHLLPIQTN